MSVLRLIPGGDKPKPRPSVVAHAEELLERARTGELISIACVAETADREIFLNFSMGVGSSWSTLVGAVGKLWHELLDAWAKEDEGG